MQIPRRIPFFLVLSGFTAVAMLAPALVAFQIGDYATARSFFYSSLLLMVLTLLVGLAVAGQRPKNVSRAQLLTLAAAYLLLPLVFAVPFRQAVPDTTYLNSVFEMVSCFTTTGATAFDPGRLDVPLHLWRAEVGWLGGLFAWITLAAVMAPLNLGGFEVSAASEPGRGVAGRTFLEHDQDTGQRLLRSWNTLMPIYAGLTLVLWICLILVGTDPMTSLVRAMGTLSTSGIDGNAPVAGHATTLGGEFLMFMFLFFAISRRTFSTDSALRTWVALKEDPEIRVGVILVAMTTGLLFLSHFWSAVKLGTQHDTVSALSAFWGILFTVLSFLTTTGYVSVHWSEAQQWSGLGTDTFALAGLAVLGGGVATTAGGIKLLRVYALYVQARHELNRLVHPSMVLGKGRPGREVLPKGVLIAWVFFVLFAMSIAAVWLGLAFFGLDFDHALLMTLSALTTTGPLAPVVSNGAVTYQNLSPHVKELLMVAMVLGRLETLAVIALLNAELWRG